MEKQELISIIKNEDPHVYSAEIEFHYNDGLLRVSVERSMIETKQRGGSYEGWDFEEWNEENVSYEVTEITYINENGDEISVEFDETINELINHKINEL